MAVKVVAMAAAMVAVTVAATVAATVGAMAAAMVAAAAATASGAAATAVAAAVLGRATQVGSKRWRASTMTRESAPRRRARGALRPRRGRSRAGGRRSPRGGSASWSSPPPPQPVVVHGSVELEWPWFEASGRCALRAWSMRASLGACRPGRSGARQGQRAAVSSRKAAERRLWNRRAKGETKLVGGGRHSMHASSGS